ncbi:MAG: rRNA pseudouridine synthase [Defluviitaleaceae bacterium]|nr:rRNA pseudouridine synthase [Defluviitaleaceae bacterium]
MVRLQKLLASAGIASRRKAEELIIAGRVRINGEVAAIGAKAAATDEITVNGAKINGVACDGRPAEKIYIMLHKPRGVVTTVKDQFGRKSVMDYAPAGIRLFPVGRLDYDTSGLLFLTNDGEWANNLMHPRNNVEKTYIAKLRGEPSEDALRDFRSGIKIDGQQTAPAEIELTHKSSVYQIKIREGRNRQIRKMCEAIGHPVVSLKRVAIGEVRLGGLASGKWRHLTAQERIK